MTTGTSLTAAAASIVGHPTQAASLESTSATTTYHRMTVEGVGIFYREAGPKNAPTIVLLHGFPSSSREFDTLIPLLATRYHLIAPDFPGFGQSDAPPPSSYVYTFDNLAKTINELLEQLNIDKYTFFLHDYGGPVGFRIISAHPERLQALIIQNANAYKEGLGAKWAAIAQYWADPKAHPEVFDAFVSLTATEQRHTLGTSHPERYNPDTWTDEYAHLSRPGNTRSRRICSTTTERTLLRIRRGKHGCVSTSRRLWLSGGGTILRSLVQAAKRSSATCRMPRSIYSTLAISPWTRRTTRSRVLFLRSWPNIPFDRSARRSRRRAATRRCIVGPIAHRLWRGDTEHCIDRIFSRTSHVQQQEASHNAEIFVKAIHVVDSLRARHCPIAMPKTRSSQRV